MIIHLFIRIHSFSSTVQITHSKSFHIFTVSSQHLYGYITNSHNDQLRVGLMAQLVEHCTGIAEVMGSNPFQA